MYLIKEAAQLSGVSVKTLHHYDKIGLLVPRKQENGYRYYRDEELNRLQVILFYKFLGFRLSDIAELLNQSKKDLLPHLNRQLHLLEKKKEDLDTLITTLQKTIQSQKGDIQMTTKEKFTGFTYEENTKYHDAAVEKYGKTVLDQSLERQKGKENEVVESFNQIFQDLARNLEKGLAIEAEENLAQAAKLFQAMNTYAFDCSLEVFGAIGMGYVTDPEFKTNIDRFGQGLAQYVSDIIQFYVKQTK